MTHFNFKGFERLMIDFGKSSVLAFDLIEKEDGKVLVTLIFVSNAIITIHCGF